LKLIQLHKNENQLLIELKNNKREAQQTLFEMYSPKMLGVCRQYVIDMQHAEELMLNGFLKVFTKISNFQNKGSFEGWIRRIMINECISFLRIKKRMVFIANDSFFTEEVTIEFTDDTNNVSQLQYLVDNLREDLRVVFNLFVVEEYKHKEIAELLEITENASKLRYRKAKNILQEQYNSLNIRSYEK